MAALSTFDSAADLSGLRVLVVDDEESIRFGLTRLLTQRGASARGGGTLKEALETLNDFRPDIVLLDLRLPDADGLSGLKGLLAARPDIRVVLMTAYGTIDTAVAAIRAGAEDFLTKPVDSAHLLHVVGRVYSAVRLKSENEALRRELEIQGKEFFWGQSSEIQRLLAEARRVATTDAIVMLSGESGTGKGALAREIHGWSSRREAPFVNVNCAGLSRDLLESELFGHEKGAFTGAAATKPGLFELAQRGTLFLDEIAEVDTSVQPRLLKAIEEKRFHRVGGLVERNVDIRLIAATNRDLKEAVAAGAFRSDLYFRLNVIELRLPPLRERPGDAPRLAQRFLVEFDAKAGRGPRRFSPRSESLLSSYSWPGNIRELRNLTERLSILSSTESIEPEEISGFLGLPPDAASGHLPTLEEKELEYVEQVLRFTGGNKSAAAEILGITRNTLYAKLRERAGEDGTGGP